MRGLGIIHRPNKFLPIGIHRERDDDAHESMLAKIREILSAVIGIDGAEEGVVCVRIGQATLLESLEAPFDILRRELERFLGNMAGGTSAGVAVNVWELGIENDGADSGTACSAV